MKQISFILDMVYQPVTSEDGVAEAIQLLSCRPSRFQPTVGPPFIEESSAVSVRIKFIQTFSISYNFNI